MKSRTVVEIMNDLSDVRDLGNETYAYYKSLKATEEGYRLELDAMLRSMGLREAKTSDGKLTAYFTKRQKITVFDPADVRAWLKSHDMLENDYFKPDTRLLATLNKSAFKELGENIAGIEVTEDESLSLKDNSKKKTNEPTE